MNMRIPAEWGSGPTVREMAKDIESRARREGREIKNLSRAELV
jgi:hypothetical protein